MSCRHDLANTTCSVCYPDRGGLDSNGRPQVTPDWPGESLDGLGAKRKPLVIYHAGCMDGAGAALAAWLKLGDDAEYRPANYGDPAPTDDEVRGRDVYVLDFSYPRAELERLVAVCGNDSEHPRGYDEFIVLDHHKTAQADLADLPFCRFDMNKSGAALAWEHFHGLSPKACPRHRVHGDSPRSRCEDCGVLEPLPDLIAYIQDRDLWRWELPHSREVSAALAARGCAEDWRELIPIYKDWSGYIETNDNCQQQLIVEGAAVLRAQEQHVARVVATAEEVEIVLAAEHVPSTCERRGYSRVTSSVRALAASCPLLQSEVGEALALESARRGRDAVGVVYYRDGEKGKWRVSLRSRDVEVKPDDLRYPRILAPDVSAVAKSFGGGGHAKAAGFECSELPWVRGTPK